MTHKTIQTAFFLLLLLGVLVLTGFLIRPFIAPLILAFTLAVVFHPLYVWTVRLLRGSKVIAALLTILVILVVALGPLIFFGVQVFQEGRDFYLNRLSGNDSLLALPGQKYIAPYLQQGLMWILRHVGVVFSSIAHLVFTIFLTLIALYYFFTHGSEFKERLVAFSPLSDRYDEAIIGTLERAVASVIKGVLVVAIVQALLSGIGFALFGIPNPALWGSIAMIAALIPGFGTALVMIPAVIYLFVTGHPAAAVGLTIWGALFVGLIDNLLSPLLVGRGIKIHTFLILLGVLGGLALFGPVGFLAGPLILSLLFALLDIYPLLILKKHDDILGT